jgi:rsbT co-antagonist protein RsbR
MEKSIHVGGIDVAWNEELGLNLWAGSPAVTMWTETSMSGLMAGMQRMVGTERFNLALKLGGRESVEGDWQVITASPTFEEGFEALGRIAAAAGWGRWRIVQLDREKKEARFQITNCWEALYQRSLGVCWGSSVTAGKLAGYCGRLFGSNCWAEQTAFMAQGGDVDEFEVRLSDRTIEADLEGLLRSDAATRADLAVAMEKLRQEVLDRAEAEKNLREKLLLIERQEQAIRVMSTPIIQVWTGVLTLPVIGVLDARRASEMMERLLAAIVNTSARYAILDFTGVEEIDVETADHLVKIIRSVELLGAGAIVTGIRPAVAQTMISLAIDLSGITTLGNLQEGLLLCMKSLEKAQAAAGGISARGPR